MQSDSPDSRLPCPRVQAGPGSSYPAPVISLRNGRTFPKFTTLNVCKKKRKKKEKRKKSNQI